MRLCALALMSLFSTQTPVVAGFDAPEPVEVVTLRLPWSVDASSLDACAFTKEGSARAPEYVCTITNPMPIDRPLIKSDSSTSEITAPLPDSNRFQKEADAALKIVVTPNAIQVTVGVVVKREYRGYDLLVGFKSRDEAVATARRILADQPDGRVSGALLIGYVK